MSTEVPSFYRCSDRCDVGEDHQRVVDVSPRIIAGGVVNDDVVIDEKGVESQVLGLAGRFDDGLSRGGETQVVGVG